MEAGEYALHSTLFVGRYVTGGVGLQGGTGNAGKTAHADDGVNHPALGGQAVADVGDDRDPHANDHGPGIAQLGHDFFDERRLNQAGGDPHEHEGQADLQRIPAVALLGVECPSRLQHDLRKRDDEKALDQTEHGRKTPHREQRADGIGALPGEAPPVFRLERFRQDKKSPHPVQGGAARRKPERQADVVLAEQAAHHRPDDEADAKGGALLILYALEIERQRGFAGYKTLTVLFNPDEEKSSLGSRVAIQKISADQDYVLVYEPPEADQVTVATNGIAYVHLDVKGLASHAGSAPEKGRNAVVELSHQIMQLTELGNAKKGTTVNWTVLQTGERVNIIPDKASAIADMRMSELSELDRVQQDANRLIQTKFIPDTSVTVKVENRRPPFSKNPASDKLAALSNDIYQELGKHIQPVSMRYGTDAGFAYHPGSDKPVVLDGMGIVGDRIHSSEEWADLNSVEPRLYLTVRLLETLSK